MSVNTTASKQASGRYMPVLGILVASLAFLIYYLTAFRTITWWENPEFSLAAVALGVPHPPGGLLPIMVGWIATLLVGPASKAFALNLLAGLIAAGTVTVVYAVAISLRRRTGDSDPVSEKLHPQAMVVVGAALGALTLAFCRTLWQHGTYFSPYIFTALMTILIVAAMTRWWRGADDKDAGRWLFLILLLIGLDFSVHRTNALLIPALVVWILLRRPKTIVSLRAWGYGVLGMLLGLAFHLLLIPMAAAGPAVNANDPSSLSRFWSYVSLQQYGGGWLFNLLPRKAPFWDVQVIDYLKGFTANFLPGQEWSVIIGAVSLLMGLIGLAGLWRRDRRFAIGMILLFVMTSAGAVIYFNIPNDFFRSMYRHYLPSFVIFGIWVAYGGAIIMDGISRIGSRLRTPALVAAACLLVAVPVSLVAVNYHTLDGSRNHFAYDYAHNLLQTMPDRSILFTFGDNDTFNLWYLQGVEHVRPDVTVINVWLLNTAWYVGQLMKHDPDLPLHLDSTEVASLSARPWKDTTVTFMIRTDPKRFALTPADTLPDSISVMVPGSFGNPYLITSEWLTLQMLAVNDWNRPIFFSAAGYGSIPQYWKPYLRPEGLAYRLVPIINPSVNVELLRRNLFDVYAYRGLADPTVTIDDAFRGIGTIYLGSFLTLAGSVCATEGQTECDRVKSRMMELIPPQRLEPLPPQLKQALQGF